jgi:DNA modification methylase
MIQQVILGDCMEKMKDIPDKSVDLILCDPPYAVTEQKWDLLIPFDKMWEAYWRIGKANCVVVITSIQPFTTLLISSNIVDFKYDWIWEKDAAGTGWLPKTILRFKRDASKLHPTQKPVSLFSYLIQTYTDEGDLVLDSCAGSGTTGVACKQLNRNFILIEKNEEYFKMIQDRLDAVEESVL